LTDASVILCVRNGAATIAEQLAALAEQECPHPWELVVVDNGSSDHTVSIVEQWRDRIPGLRIVPANEKAALPYARNVGARAAAGGVLAFCDADDVADQSWLAGLIAGAHEADIVGGRLELDLLNDGRARSWRWFSGDELWRPTALGYLPYAVGANFAVRRQAFEAVGGCDEAFTFCSDDVDLSWRIQGNGGTLTFREDALMHYRLRADLRGMMRQQYLYGRTEALLRRKFTTEMPPARWREQWPLYRHLITRSWHLVAGSRRRGSWLSRAAYCGGRLSGAVRYGIVHF
jgi:glycosyltransferase involved in cell wall biosynthesis